MLAMGAVVVALAAAAAAAWYLRPLPEVPVRRLELSRAIAEAPSMALAPNGSRIAYLSGGRLHVRELHDTTPRDLGSVPASSGWLFWSPDSRNIGFVADASIRTIPADGGSIFTVCRIPESGRVMGAAWRPDGAIVFSVWRENLYSVPATGGTPEVILRIDSASEVDFHGLSPLPDGKMIVSVHVRAGDTDRAELVDGTLRTVLTADPGVRHVKYVHPGRLLFLRTGANRGLWTVPFASGPLDLTRAELLEPDATGFDVAGDGTALVRADAPATTALVWVDRDGAMTDVPGSPISDLRPWVTLSPQGDRATFAAGPLDQASVFVRDLASGVDTRVTFQDRRPADVTWAATQFPVWSPAGDRVLYASGPVEGSKIMAARADGSDVQRELVTGVFARISPDGRFLLWIADERGQGRLKFAPLSTDGTLGEPQPAFPGAEDVSVRLFDLSPDGRLLALSGRERTAEAAELNVFLTEFPGGAARWRVPIEAATAPLFSPDGKELFFVTRAPSVSAAGALMAVPLTLTPSLKLGRAAPVITADAVFFGSTPAAYDIARDGRLLMARRGTSPADTSRAVLVQNWPAALALKR